MQARVIAGWITEADLPKKPEQPRPPPASRPDAGVLQRRTPVLRSRNAQMSGEMSHACLPSLTPISTTDRGPTGPRRCGCARSPGQVQPIDKLIRFVVSPQGEVMADLKRKLPGRGLWVAASRQVVAEAVRRHQFGKGFKREVRVAPTLAADTEALLVRSAIDALAMAAKAGQVVDRFQQGRGRYRGCLGTAPGPDLDPRRDPCLRTARRTESGNWTPSSGKMPGKILRMAINPPVPGCHGADLGTIGFGTGPVKCDTCSPARGPASKTFLSRSHAPGPIPDGG